MSTPPPRPPAPRHRLPAGTTIAVAILLLIPCVALAIVPVYSRQTPKLWGWPFFYWYQVLWIVLTPIVTWIAYKLVQRARGER
jgi:uncharacterized membrane protein YdbT with pleckstrin-like domain